jgi:hypothetical protein
VEGVFADIAVLGVSGERVFDADEVWGMSVSPIFVLVSIAFIVVASSAQPRTPVASRSTNVTLICNIQTIEHLNCGGGLTVPGATPPDCTNFVSEHVVGKKRTKILVPSDRFFYDRNNIKMHFMTNDAMLNGDGRRITYETGRNLFSDAAGYSVDRGVCTITSGKNNIRRAEALGK